MCAFKGSSPAGYKAEVRKGATTLGAWALVRKHPTHTTLWRYNSVTGYWAHERLCENSSAEEWLSIFQKDDPDFFALSDYKPRAVVAKSKGAQ